jgi:hypothetical protein
VLIAAAFVWVFNPRRGLELLKKLAAVLVGVIFGIALFTHLASTFLANADSSWLFFVVPLEPCSLLYPCGAECGRSTGRCNWEKPQRTPVMPSHNIEDDA